MRQAWIIYKSDDPDGAGWEDRQLLPSGSLTSILSEEWHYSSTPEIPKVGDRFREYANVNPIPDDIGEGVSGNFGKIGISSYTHIEEASF